MTDKQRQDYNTMLAALQKIAKGYQTPAEIQRFHERDYGLPYEEVLAMAYENMQGEARAALKGVRAIAEPERTR